jgi:hypothetical protein
VHELLRKMDAELDQWKILSKDYVAASLSEKARFAEQEAGLGTDDSMELKVSVPGDGDCDISSRDLSSRQAEVYRS